MEKSFACLSAGHYTQGDAVRRNFQKIFFNEMFYQFRALYKAHPERRQRSFLLVFRNVDNSRLLHFMEERMGG